jgi:ATP-dependent Clp protease ATP-binding subunit ClpC
MPLLSPASQTAFNLAAIEAQALNNKFIEKEHLFLGLCKVEDILNIDKETTPLIRDFEWDKILSEIRNFRDFLTTKGIDCKKSRRRLRKIIQESELEKGEFSGHRTQNCREVFAEAERLSRDAGEEQITLKKLLMAVLKEQSPLIEFLFMDLSIDSDNLLKDINIGSPLEVNSKNISVTKKKETPFLDRFGRDLTQLARDGKLDPTIGRKDEIKKVAQILVQLKKKNPILVGDAGVGKTCIVEGLAQKILVSDSSMGISNLRIVELSMSSLVSGTKYRGEFEERLERLIDEASSDPNIVLFIDEIHTIVGAGAVEGGAIDAGNILKPALARGAIKCIGATTTSEYRKYIEKDSALERRFQIVWVDEPTKEETILILKELRQNIEEHYKIKISDAVIEKTVELSMRYLIDFRFPDKAIDILDQACSRRILRTLSAIKSNEENTTEELNIEDIALVVSERCRVPVESLTMEESEKLLKMENYLSQRIMGQKHAIKEVSDVIRSSKAGLKDPKKPIGIFLFLGPTGTGKTEFAKALADFLFHDEKCLLTFDMSEYQEKHSVAKLIGAPPGYIGYDEEGQLASKVRSNPYSIVLFDEIEKAHPDIFDLFLQIFDEGRLTDAHGRKVNFSETIIILTSNIGSRLTEPKKPIGINLESNLEDSVETVSTKNMEDVFQVIESEELHKKWGALETQIYREVNRTFRPELLNRISRKTIFYPLSRVTVKSIIVEKVLKDLNQRLSSKEIQIILCDSALELLIDKGYSEIYGARELQRTFERLITEPLSQMILRKDVTSGQIQVSASSGKIHCKSIV